MLQESKRLLTEGIEAAEAERNPQAEDLLADALALYPENAEAWMWRARVAATAEGRRACLQRAYKLNPANEAARREPESHSNMM